MAMNEIPKEELSARDNFFLSDILLAEEIVNDFLNTKNNNESDSDVLYGTLE